MCDSDCCDSALTDILHILHTTLTESSRIDIVCKQPACIISNVPFYQEFIGFSYI